MKNLYRTLVLILLLILIGFTIWKYEKFLAFFEQPEKLFLFAFMGFSLAVKQFIVYNHGTEMWRSIKGDDDKLQIYEIAGLAWLLNFELLLYAEVFFLREASDKIWYSMDIIFTTIILGDFGSKFVKHKYNSNEESKDLPPTGG